MLVDPAWLPAELAALATDLVDAEVTVAAGFATHAHHDHLLWHPGLGDPPRYASAAVARLAGDERAALVTAVGADFPDELVELMGRVQPVPDDFWPDAELITHDAHSTGHTAIWLAAQKVLLAGDMLSDIELPLAQETGIAAYDAGLEKLREFVELADIVVPGHGAPSRDPMQRWLADRRYLDSLTGESGAGPGPCGSGEDPRLTHPDLADAHAANLAAAASTG